MQDNLDVQRSQSRWKERIIPLVGLLVGVVAIATTTLFIKLALQDMSVNSTMFNRLWLASLVFISLSSYQRINQRKGQQNIDQETSTGTSFQGTDILLLAVASIVYIIGRYLWIFCLNETTVANAMILNSLVPLFTTVGGWLFLRQTFSTQFLIGLAVAVLGSLTLGFAELQKVDISWLGDATALLSGVFFAATLLIIEKIRDKFSPSTILLWRCLFGLLIILPPVLLFEPHIFPTTKLGWAAVISIAAIGEAIGHSLTVYSIKFFSSSFVAISLLLEPIVAIILAWIIFSEGLDNLTWLSLLLVLAGVYLAQDNGGDDVEERPAS